MSLSLRLQAQQSDEQLAAYYYDHNEFAQAAQLYGNLYGHTDNVYYYQRLLQSYLELGDYKAALKLVERRIKIHPRELSLYVDEGTVFKRQGQERKAEKCYERAISSVSADLQPVQDLAQAFINAKLHGQAVKVYLAARTQTNNAYLYFNELVGVYMQMGDYKAMSDEYFALLDSQPGMMQSVQVSMQKALADAADNQLSDAIRKALVSRLRTHSDSRVWLEMMIWFSLQERDFGFALEQAEAVDRRFPELGGEQVMRVAQIAQQNRSYEVAESAFAYLHSKGNAAPYYVEGSVGELEVAFARMKENGTAAKDTKQLCQRYLAVLDELGKNERTVSLMRQYAELVAYYTDNVQEAVDMLDDVLALPRIKPRLRDEVKLELGDLLLFAAQPWDASLLYMQVEKSNKEDILGATAKYKNAKLSYYNHDFKWASSQLNVLRSSTSKLIANDAMELSLLISDNMEDDSTYGLLEVFADADLLMYRNMLDSAWTLFDRVEKSTPSHPLLDDVLMRKAQIRTLQGRYTESDSLWRVLVERYPDGLLADDALMARAELNEKKLGDVQTALECYEKILLDYPASLGVEKARSRYNELKTK